MCAAADRACTQVSTTRAAGRNRLPLADRVPLGLELLLGRADLARARAGLQSLQRPGQLPHVVGPRRAGAVAEQRREPVQAVDDLAMRRVGVRWRIDRAEVRRRAVQRPGALVELVADLASARPLADVVADPGQRALERDVGLVELLDVGVLVGAAAPTTAPGEGERGEGDDQPPEHAPYPTRDMALDPSTTALGTWSGGRFMHFGAPLDDD